MHIYMDDTCARRGGSEAPLEISYSPGRVSLTHPHVSWGLIHVCGMTHSNV